MRQMRSHIQYQLIDPDLYLPQAVSGRVGSFLRSLASPSGKNKYKRYLGSPLRYAGGKSLAVGLALERMPPNVDTVVSPFLGGGSVEVALARELGVRVIAYDIFDILVNFWKVLLSNPLELHATLAKLRPTRTEFKRVKARLKKHWTGESPLGSIKLAAYYYFNHNTSYGPHFLGWPSDVYLQKARYLKMIQKIREFRAPTLEVACASFEDVIPAYESEFLYCDPPYYLDGDSKTFIGMYPHRNFPVHHNGFDHAKLRDLLIAHRGGFLLHYNDCSTIREWYSDFEMIAPSWQYTFSQGDTRIGENRKTRNNGNYVKKSHELLIWRLPR